MSSPPSPRKRSWRAGADQGSADAGPRKPKGWHGQPDAPQAGRPWWKTRAAKLALVAALMVGVFATTVRVLRWWHPVPPMRLVLLGAGYEDNLAVPHNVPGARSLDALARWADAQNAAAGGDDQIEVHRAELGDDDEAITRPMKVSWWNKWWQRRPPTVVVFVAAHGVARGDGEGLAPCLVRQNDDLRDPANLFRLDKLLDALAELDPDTKKLLILDVTRAGAHGPLGQLHNDFARALESRADRVRQIRNLVVLSSSGHDQRSWDAPERGVTAFTDSLLRRLSAANGRLDALDLYQHVRDKVEHWAANNRARLQKPVLVGADGPGRPEDQAAMKERARRLEVQVQGSYEPEGVPALDAAQQKALEGAWRQCQELSRSSLPPTAYAPHLWRKYLDTLLRYEQLLRAGDRDVAPRLLEKLERLREGIVGAGPLKRDSALLSMTMPDVLALGEAPGERAALAAFAKLLQEGAPRPAYSKALAALEKTTKDRDRQRLLRVRAAALVLRQAARPDAPEGQLAYARGVLADLDDPLPPWRPAESHYLVMLRPNPGSAEDSPVVPLLEAKRWPLLRRSLGLRLLAEEAAVGLGGESRGERLPAYSERLLPWLRPIVEEADRQRRFGEDLLFSSEPEKWERAQGMLSDAEQRYRRAQALALGVRRALRERDEALAALPYYTRWVAGRPPLGDEDEELATRLWEDLHRLRRELERPPTKDDAPARAAALAKLAAKVREGSETLAARLRAVADKDYALENNQDSWHELENVLAVPLPELKPDDRLRLIQASRDVSRKLEEGTATGAAAPGVSPQGNEEQARRAAQREGRLALATLGEEWDEHKEVAHKVRHPEEGAWHRSLARAGERLGRALNRLPEEAQKAAEEAAGAGPDMATQGLRAASRRARQLDGYMVGAPRLAADPVGQLRRLELYELMNWQARRTFLDYWASERPRSDGPHYYQAAGAGFIQDAAALLTGKAGARPVRFARVEWRPGAPAAVTVESSASGDPASFRPDPARLDLTDEAQGAERYYRLTAPAGVPEGYPVYRVERDAGLGGSAAEGQWRTRTFDQPPFAARLRVEGRAARQPLSHRVRVYFRGHRAEVETKVYWHREPDLTLSLPRPPKGGRVAVQTEAKLYGADAAVALVLDSSGSMLTPGKDGRTRFSKAKQALRSVLGQLPKGVTVSLRVFVRKKVLVDGRWADKDVPHLLWPAQKWQASHLDSLMEEVGKLKLGGATPLVRATWQAKDDFPRAFKGERSVVVLTDGADTYFNFFETLGDKDLRDRIEKGPKTIQAFLRQEFGGSGVRLKVIGFEVSDDEKKLSKSPFDGKTAYDAFKEAVEELKGEHYDAENPEQLGEALRRSLLRDYYWIDPAKGSGGLDAKQGNNISRPPDSPRWVPLESGFYRARVAAAPSLRQEIEVYPGDSLLLELVDGKKGPALRRGRYADSDFITGLRGYRKLAKPRDGWHLGVLQNEQLPGGDRLTLMATLEKDEGAARPDAPLQQVRPRWVWFEVPAAGAKVAAPPLRVAPLPDYPAPAWGLELPTWPKDEKTGRPAASALEAWWWPSGQALPEAGRLAKPFPKTPWAWRLEQDPGQITLESLRVEECRVEGGAKVKGLVVRLRYPEDKGPFFVQLRDWRGGQEHRFYAGPGKYTAVFYPCTEEEAEELTDLQLISVPEFKKHARTLKEKLELGKPNASPRPPRP